MIEDFVERIQIIRKNQNEDELLHFVDMLSSFSKITYVILYQIMFGSRN